MTIRLLVVCVASLVLLPSAVVGDYTLIAANSEWKYDDSGTDNGETWGAIEFDDSGWASGPGPLGYGDGDETTVIGFGGDEANKYPTAYFRKTVEVYDTASFTAALRFRAQWDDGIKCFVNGVQAIVGNVPSPTLYTSLAFSPISNAAQERNYNIRDADVAATLQEGKNVIACEVHQATVDSSDLRFDAVVEVLGIPEPSPSPSPIPPSVTPSISLTPSPTISLTPSISDTPSVTSTVTPTISESPSVTPTATPTPISQTPTISVTPTVSMSASPTSSYGSSPSRTPTRTPTISVTPTVSRTPSVTPSVSPTVSITPTISTTPTASPSIGSFEATGCFCSCDNLGCCGRVDEDIRNRCASAAGTGDTDMWLVMASAGAILVVGCCVTSAVWVQMRSQRNAAGGTVGEPSDYSKFQTSELLAAHAAALTAATNLAKVKDGSAGSGAGGGGSSSADKPDTSSSSSKNGHHSDLDSDPPSPGPRPSRLAQHPPDGRVSTALSHSPWPGTEQPAMSAPMSGQAQPSTSRPASVTVDLTSQRGASRTPTPTDMMMRSTPPPPAAMGPSMMAGQPQPHPQYHPSPQLQQQQQAAQQQAQMMQPQAVWVPSPTHGVATNPMFNPAPAPAPYWAVSGPGPARALAAPGVPVQRGTRRVRKVKKVRKKKQTGMFDDSSDEEGSAWAGLGVSPKF